MFRIMPQPATGRKCSAGGNNNQRRPDSCRAAAVLVQFPIVCQGVSCYIMAQFNIGRFTMKVTAFNGSPRREGNTSLLIGKALDALNNEGIATELVQVGGEKLHGCTACYKCFGSRDKRCAMTDDIANSCIEKMLES